LTDVSFSLRFPIPLTTIVIVIDNEQQALQDGTQEGRPEDSETKVSKLVEDPNSASTRIKNLVKDKEAEKAVEKAAKEEADRTEEALRAEELQQRLRHDGAGQSSPSQTGAGQFGLDLSGSADDVLHTTEQLNDLLKSTFANVSTAGGSQQVRDPVNGSETLRFP
jgi:hypothetical protein